MKTREPAIAPPGWGSFEIDCVRGLTRTFPSGLFATFSVDPEGPADDVEPVKGEWRHMVISRKDRYPGWDEMRDLVYDCGLFDPYKSVIMVLPSEKKRKSDYVNIHKNAFHWFQSL